MYLRANTLAEQAYAEQIVRCTGTLGENEDEPCGALVPLRLHEKTRCTACGKVFPAYSSYSRQRTRFKAVTNG